MKKFLLLAAFLLLASPAHASIALLASTTGLNDTTPAINTTGATLIVIVVSGSTNGYTFTDSVGGHSNTWVNLPTYATSSPNYVQITYSYPTYTGSGHVFNAPAGCASFCTYVVMAFSGTASSSLDQHTGTNTSGSITSTQPGSITPIQNGELIITGLGANTSTTYTVATGYSAPVTINYASGTNFGVGMAYKVQATAGAENPTWSFTSGNSVSAIASFEAAASGAPYGAGQTSGQPF